LDWPGESISARARDGGHPRINAALQHLPFEFREVIVLREMEELSYGAIADIIGVPIAIVMSRLSSARERLLRQLEGEQEVTL
jgi:DNA-directed RNA polymerase specialized sigma24 family protein